MHQAPAIFAFTAGVLAVLNPCAIAVLPTYGAYYIAADQTENRDLLARMSSGLKLGLFATLGFILLFGTAGALLALGISATTSAAPYLSAAIALLLLVIGAKLFLGGTVRTPSLLRQAQPLPKGKGPTSMFIFGILYGVMSLSCTLPIFLIVIGAATSQTNLLEGLGLFLIYAIGMGATLTFVTTSAAVLKSSLIKPILPYVSRFSGLALIATGIYLINRTLTLGLPG